MSPVPMTPEDSILIKNGRVLTFSPDRKVSFPQHDVLIVDNKIVEVGPNLSPRPHSRVIDATECIVSPGFIDAHRHLFQSHLRTCVANQTLLEYCSHLLLGRITFLKPEDVYLAQLGAATEAIHCGVTTVLDHSHVQLGSDYAPACIKATLESGLRSVYCFAPYAYPESLNPLKFPDPTEIHKTQVAQFYAMAKEAPLGGEANDGRLTLGLGYDGIQFRPVEDSREVLRFAHERGYPITLHDVDTYNMGALTFMKANDLLSDTLVLSHFCDPSPHSDDDFRLAKERGVGIVSTPESEMQMSHGWPEAFRALRHGCRTGLGVDSSAISSGDLFAAMRICLQTQRAHDNAQLAARGKIPSKLAATVDDVLWMATMGGAEAMHREHEIGSLEPGKLADVILIKTDGPCMSGAMDLGAAMVIHATPADVDTVIVNGEVVKEDGKLQRVDWKDLHRRLVENRKVLEERWAHIDWERNTEELATAWYMGGKLE